MDRKPMSRTVKLVLLLVALIVLALLAGQCAYNAGHWMGRH